MHHGNRPGPTSGITREQIINVTRLLEENDRLKAELGGSLWRLIWGWFKLNLPVLKRGEY